MNFAINLIMVGLFFRLTNLRTFNGFDLFADFIGGLLILLAILIGKKYAAELRQGTVPAVLYTILSLGNFYNFLSEDSTAVHMGIYIAWQVVFISVEIWMYFKLMFACREMYDEALGLGDKAAIGIYGLSLAVGIFISFMVWQTVTLPSSTEPFSTWTVIYYIYLILHIVIASYLIYSFYIKKPKFR